MSIIRFKSADNQFKLEISDLIINEIHKKCLNAGNNETGGILVGKYSLDRHTAIINKITGPPKGSIQGECTFERGVIDFNKVLGKDPFLRNRYVGEWHYHPNSSPQPSIVDNFQMKKNAAKKSLNCPETILLIIGGNKKGWEITVHVYTSQKRIQLSEE